MTPLPDKLARFHVGDTGYATPCWLWHGPTTPNGYANITIKRVPTYVHRLMYEHAIGPIPTGLHIDHLCRVRNCVNPAHLEPVTPGENIRRGDLPRLKRQAADSKTHCTHGHRLDGDNLYTEKIASGLIRRRCRTCRRALHRRLRAEGRRAA